MIAYGIRPESIRHLLITHAHYDHFQPVAIDALSSGMADPLNIYGSTTVKEALDFANEYRWDDAAGNFTIHDGEANIQVNTVGHGESFRVGDMQVTAVLANHMIDKDSTILQGQALNYVFQRAGRTLLYAIDSSYVLPKTFEVLSRFRFDIAVFDASFGHYEIEPRRSGHQNFLMLDKTIAQFKQANLFKDNTPIIADHISQHHVKLHDDIVEELAEKGITLAYDGMTIEF